MKKYDFLIVGAGLYGAVFAYEAKKHGVSCLVIDRRPQIGGNIYTENVRGIDVHVYGAHIFHTSDRRLWDYVNRFAEFNNFVNSPIAVYKDETYNLPFNMNTFSRMWNIRTPAEAQQIIERQRAEAHIENPRNLEEQALSLAGRDVYEKLIKGYTEKQWGRPCKELPAFIIKRLPFRFTYNNNYFNDRYQGIPVGGYTQIIERLLAGVDTVTDEDFFDLVGGDASRRSGRLHNGTDVSFDRVLFTGQIDAYYGFRFGPLSYRSLRFETEELPIANYQGNAVVNYTDREVPWTRIIEHKHFEFGTGDFTIISKEYPAEWKPGSEPYYPVNDESNNSLYQKYAALAAKDDTVLFGGRLGLYKYYDMDKDLAAALQLADSVFGGGTADR